MRINLQLPLLLLFCLQALGQSNPLLVKDSVAQMAWVENQFQNMSLQERIGQLFMVSVVSNQGKTATDRIKTLVEDQGIGGVIFSVGGPIQQAQLTNAYQSAAKVPLLIGSDAE